MNKDTSDSRHPPHPCPACGYYMFTALNEQSEICLICGWQNDLVDLEEMYRPMGPNKVSLEEAQRNFIRFGVTEPRLIGKYNAPKEQYVRDPKWRPIDRNKDKPRKLSDLPGKKHEELYYWHWQ